MNVFLHINGVQHVTIEQQIQLQSSVQIMPNAFGVIAVKRCLNIFIGDATKVTFWISGVFFMKRIVTQNNSDNISMTLDILQIYKYSFFVPVTVQVLDVNYIEC